MLEKEIERELVVECKKHGGQCLKFITPSMMGVPDRILLFPKGKVGFVEVKRPKEVPRPIQVRRIEQLRNLGFKVFILDNKRDIENIIKTMGGDA
ncbi:VRR-NUC domain-containing protein [Miniphocaeibacter massiliensis]|uniref:VRR-NUC domain-containing protein n=1 Tax=Miniphocaeibacter massiliensis TaxID=2041841 RepID=UPI000C1BB146|nr:VRR-NUC domain-containing protein [Miniphocaeibacter massiliensis]